MELLDGQRAPADVRFAFLALEEHPYAREMLRQLLAAGLSPALVVQERSDAAQLERGKFEERMAGFDLAPPMQAQLANTETARIFVDDHNGDECRHALEVAAPRLIVLGGTRILRPHIFEVAPEGTLNAHPGLLPQVRGSASVAWAIELDERVGCTCHFVEKGIDTGKIVSRRAIDVHRGDTYEHLCHATTVLSGTLMTEALLAYAAGELRGEPQGEGPAARRNMAPQGVAAVKAKLAQGHYAHFVD